MKDESISLDEKPIQFKKKEGVTHIVLEGTLTYRPKCGVVNESPDAIVKFGTKTSTIKLTHINFQLVLLKLRKQKFYCKHCTSYFLAQTDVVDLHCFISNKIN